MERYSYDKNYLKKKTSIIWDSRVFSETRKKNDSENVRYVVKIKRSISIVWVTLGEYFVTWNLDWPKKEKPNENGDDRW